jgi:hypothetical protein
MRQDSATGKRHAIQNPVTKYNSLEHVQPSQLIFHLTSRRGRKIISLLQQNNTVIKWISGYGDIMNFVTDNLY